MRDYAVQPSYGWPGGWRFSVYRNIGEDKAALSYESWATREEAERAAQRANAGDMTGLTLHEAPAVNR